MLEEIVKRRSIRKFTDQEVEEAKIEDLLRAAMERADGPQYTIMAIFSSEEP